MPEKSDEWGEDRVSTLRHLYSTDPDFVFRVMSILSDEREKLGIPTRILKETRIKEGQVVLDFGCGQGSCTIFAAKIVGEKGRVYALDIHPEAKKIIEEKAEKEGLKNIMVIIFDGATNLPEESVDLVFLFRTIYLVEDKSKILKEIHRVLKSNCSLCVIENMIEEKELLEMLADAGFSLMKKIQINHSRTENPFIRISENLFIFTRLSE